MIIFSALFILFAIFCVYIIIDSLIQIKKMDEKKIEKKLINEYFDDIYGSPNIFKKKFEFTKDDIMDAISFGQRNPDMTDFELNKILESFIEKLKNKP